MMLCEVECYCLYKKSKLFHKVIIIISLESSCFNHCDEHTIFLLLILLSSYLDFCEKFLKKNVDKKSF